MYAFSKRNEKKWALLDPFLMALFLSYAHSTFSCPPSFAPPALPAPTPLTNYDVKSVPDAPKPTLKPPQNRLL